MAKIRELPPHIANLIAAGEVVERPGSVVKELTENAIDAGAKAITVELQNGGMTFLRVTDDGCGMEPQDAQLAFLRHATSKISAAEDLGHIETMGFRGEALAAISSVSRIDLLTKTAQSAEGFSLHLEAGRITDRQPAGCPDGTTIIVRDLFFNTPARMKFMKSDSAEAAGVVSSVQRQALAHPDICLRVIKDGQEVFHTPGDGQLKSAVYCLYGREFAGALVPMDSHWEKSRVWGYVTRPTATRGNRSSQHFFVNGRPVKSRLMASALEQAYKNQMMSGRFPGCVLHLELPPEEVDVNVHPAKTEVKFLSDKAVFDCIHYGVLAALNKTPGRPEIKLPDAAAKSRSGPGRGPFYKTMTAEQYQTFLQAPAAAIDKKTVDAILSPAGAKTADGPRTSRPEKPADALETRSPAPASDPLKVGSPTSDPLAVRSLVTAPTPGTLEVRSPVAVPTSGAGKPSWQPLIREQDAAAKAPWPADTADETLPWVPAPTNQPNPAGSPRLSPEPAGDTQPAEDGQQSLSLPTQTFRVVGEVLDTYIIVQEGENVYFIDKHAAHERILFEKLKAEKTSVMAQSLITPLVTQLDREEAAAVLEHGPLLSEFGFEAADFGDGTVCLRQIPADLDPDDAVSSLSALADDLLAGRQLDPTALRDELLHTIACKAAIKAGYHTQPAERDELVRQVLSRDDIKYCPHGRPVCITLTKAQLEKQFKRA